jgi:type I restriction enzyme S subunit
VLPLDQLVDQVSRLVKVSDTRVYKLMGVRWYGLGCHIHTVASGSDLKTASLNQVKLGDVTYNKMWVTKGALGVIESDEELFATTEYPTFEARADRTDTRFLKYLFQSPDFLSVASDVCRGSTSRARLNPRDFLNLKVLAPPLPEQRKIAVILTAVDDAIAATEAVIEQLQVVKKAMMSELLTRGIPGRHTKFKQTEIGEIPEAWEVRPLGELLDSIDAGWSPQCESRPAREDEWGVLKVSAATGGTFRPDENKALPAGLIPRPSAEVKEGDVVLARANGVLELVGRAVLVGKVRHHLMLSDKLMRLKPKRARLSPDYLVLSLAAPAVRTAMLTNTSGSDMKNVSQASLRNLRFPVPSLDEQRQISGMLTSIEENLAKQHLGRTRLSDVKAALMAVLLTGEVRVRPAEDGE